MATQILYLHWKAARFVLVPFVLAAFGLPLLVVQGTGVTLADDSPAAAVWVLQVAEMWMSVFPWLAVGLGTTLALTAWTWDHKHDHVYALSLPVSRARYALLKFGAGVTLALIPAAAVLVGGVVASAAIELPAGLTTYPGALTVRFLLATLLVYAAVFALAAGTVRTTVVAMTVFVAVMIGGDLAMDFLAQVNLLSPEWGGFAVSDVVVRALTEWPGPFHVFVGDWTLIDV